MTGFKGVRDGAYFYKAIAPKRAGEAWRVRTFSKPMSVAAFVGGYIARAKTALVYEDGELPVTDAEGKLIFTDQVRKELRYLLGEDEINLLALFGVEVTS